RFSAPLQYFFAQLVLFPALLHSAPLFFTQVTHFSLGFRFLDLNHTFFLASSPLISSPTSLLSLT
ncbi:hypothetical protein, partial [Lysinibacillus sp. UBA6686]|uniref:hypothetical protein n=1 Tax=Lysinibacillus sp. UBA6686 TaxID=1946776 RepID=UPI00257FDB34